MRLIPKMVHNLLSNLTSNTLPLLWKTSTTTSHSASSSSPPPTDRLYHCLRRREWEAASQRLEDYPSDVYYTASDVATVLHAACLYRAPHCLMDQLIQAHPAALLRQDAEGWTPLHVFLLYGTVEDTAILMIQRGGSLAAGLHSSWVGSALHLACRHCSSMNILKALIGVNPEQITRPNETGCYPATLLYKSALKLNMSDADLLERFELLWEAVYDDCLEIMLHQVVDFAYRFAPQTQLVQLYLRQPKSTTRTRLQGQLPIHVAASLPPRTNAEFASRQNGITANPLLLLLNHDPSTAQCVDQSTGRLPLHIAVAHGWKDSESLHRLVHAYPTALARRDPCTGFYPFQLLAVDANKDDDDSLSTLYQLLVACPHVLDPLSL